MRIPTKSLVITTLILALPALSWAQASSPAYETGHQHDLEVAHSAVQKTGLATLVVTGALGAALMANMDTLLSEGRCRDGDPVFGEFGCNGGLSVLHFAFAATTLGLWLSSEGLAEAMQQNPYYTGNLPRDHATQGLRWAQVGLFATQPVLGLLGAHPALLGLHGDSAAMFSRVVRTVHFGVGLGVAATYTANAIIQW